MVEISASSPYIDYATWYTQGYFDHHRSPVKARLFVHDLPVARMPPSGHDRPESPLRRVVFPTAPEALCFIDDEQGAVHLLPRDGSRPLPLLLVMRVLRALVMRELMLQDALFFHAACFTLQDSGVALLGARTAGKTTMLPGVGGHCLPVDPTYLSWQVRPQTDGAPRRNSRQNQHSDASPRRTPRDHVPRTPRAPT
ncbi:hypothetical protein [Streptomyces sp. NPDC050564]|uniref:hypothetical protein n=1 Tax=Streptomyces sp. NPDC050564 TaxID=3365631 RepID=UPI003794EAA7